MTSKLIFSDKFETTITQQIIFYGVNLTKVGRPERRKQNVFISFGRPKSIKLNSKKQVYSKFGEVLTLSNRTLLILSFKCFFNISNVLLE